MTVPIKFELSIMQVGSSLRVTIPKEIAQYLNLKKGETVSMWVDDSHIIIEKKVKE
jgi:AbrB family looped-hinge helix DNA binding protein